METSEWRVVVAKLTKRAAALHRKACDLVATERALTEEEKEFVLTHWQESAGHITCLHGAFFTPLGLARDMSLMVTGNRIVDLGAGIGHLAWGCRDVWTRRWNGESAREFVCVESNPDYVAVGRKVLPEAEWICGDVFDLPGTGVGEFDCAIANPPFGYTPRAGAGPRYRGRRAEYHFLDIAAGLARRGVFLVPQLTDLLRRCS